MSDLKKIGSLLEQLKTALHAHQWNTCYKLSLALAREDVALVWEARTITRSRYDWQTPDHRCYATTTGGSVSYEAWQLGGAPYRMGNHWTGGAACRPVEWQNLPADVAVQVDRPTYKQAAKMLQNLQGCTGNETKP